MWNTTTTFYHYYSDNDDRAPRAFIWLIKLKVQNLGLLSFLAPCLETDLQSQELWNLVI